MVTIISLLTFISFYLLYGTSQKMVAVGELGLEKWIGEHKKTSQYASMALMILSLGLSCLYWGWGSGVFSFFILLMTMASLIILLTPLPLINYVSLSLTLILGLFFEIILF